MRPGDRAWIALGVGVGAYEVIAVEGELMSEAADRYMERHPWMVRAVAFTLAAHVANCFPDRYDPLHWLFLAKQKFR